jgi:dTDP-L-rhamnose 4-epimerase
MSTVLVTGGCGFIGTGVVRRLASGGHTVVIADHLHPQVHPDTSALDALPVGVVHHPVDVTHAPAMDALVRIHRPDVVVHLAAETGTGQSLTEASRHGLVNVVGTTNLLDAFSRAGYVPDTMVLTSSRAVYGEGAWVDEADGTVFHPGQRRPDDLAAGRWDPPAPSGGPCRPLPHRAGHTEPRPTNVYAATKLAQEHLLTSWCTAMGVSSQILRLQNVYGPGQSPTNSYTGVLTFFAVRAASGAPIEVYEDGEIVRDFVYVDDVVDEVVAAAERKGTSALLDVGSGRRSTIAEAARLIAEASHAPAPVVTGAFRLGDVRSAWADPPEIDHPRTPIEVGLRRLVDHMMSH